MKRFHSPLHGIQRVTARQAELKALEAARLLSERRTQEQELLRIAEAAEVVNDGLLTSLTRRTDIHGLTAGRSALERLTETRARVRERIAAVDRELERTLREYSELHSRQRGLDNLVSARRREFQKELTAAEQHETLDAATRQRTVKTSPCDERA